MCKDIISYVEGYLAEMWGYSVIWRDIISNVEGYLAEMLTDIISNMEEYLVEEGVKKCGR